MSRENLTKIVFQSSLGLILLKGGLAELCIPPGGLQKEGIFDLVVLRKKVLRQLSDSELKKLSRENLTKIVFQSSLGLILLK